MDLFQDKTSRMPKSDSQIKKIDFQASLLKATVPTPNKEGDMAIRHVPNAGTTR